MTSWSWFATMSNPETQNSTGKEEDGGQEAESLSSLPFGARVFGSNVNDTPGEGTSTMNMTEPVDKESECSKPSQRENNVGGNMEHMADGWEHPDKSKESGKNGDNKSVNLTSVRSTTNMDEMGDETHDYHSADEFRKAEDERQKT